MPAPKHSIGRILHDLRNTVAVVKVNIEHIGAAALNAEQRTLLEATVAELDWIVRLAEKLGRRR